MQRAAAYLSRNSDERGRFVYLRHPTQPPASSYNVLRHAGTLYAMAQFYAAFGGASVQAAALRSGRYLQRHHIAPVPKANDLVAVWEDDIAHDDPNEAKLGGAGLALVAAAAWRRNGQTILPLATMQQIARFVLFLQRKDGSFYSKYIRSKNGRDGSWTSLYYPGEAALGLVMLYEHDSDLAWLRAATRALAHLSRKRRGKRRVPADHWALLATERVLRHWHKLGDTSTTGVEPAAGRKHLIDHAVQIAKAMLRDRRRANHRPGAPAHGSFDSKARTTPTATRLEGLQALLRLLPHDHRVRSPVQRAVTTGVAFLQRAQIRGGVLDGGMPRALLVDGEGHSSRFARRAREVRIDYVQHALSAWLAYHAATTKTTKLPPTR